jgi:UPF0716 protein FxsA
MTLAARLMFPVFVLLFLIVPLVEIYVLIQVGGVIGALWTVVLVVFTAVLGAGLLRLQGLTTFLRFRNRLDVGELPAEELVEGILLLLAGALLLTPGFVTDTAGFALLIPPLRRRLALAMLARMELRIAAGASPGPGPHAGPARHGRARHRSRVIEGEWQREDEDSGPESGPGGRLP